MPNQLQLDFKMAESWLQNSPSTLSLIPFGHMDRKIQGIEPTVLELQTCSAIAQAPLSTDWDRSE